MFIPLKVSKSTVTEHDDDITIDTSEISFITKNDRCTIIHLKNGMIFYADIEIYSALSLTLQNPNLKMCYICHKFIHDIDYFISSVGYSHLECDKDE